jgi:hypothetical protein
MSVRRWGIAWALAAVAACAPQADRTSGGDTPLEQGRTYTAWLYQSQYQKLWDRFSPEMRQTFGSAADLAAFAGEAVRQLGPERGSVEEQVADGRPFRVYTRTVTFDGVRPPMLIQWSLADDGLVTGLVVRPAPQNVR